MAFNKETYILSSCQRRHKYNICIEKDDKNRIYRKHAALKKEATLGRNDWHISVGNSVERIDSAISSQPMQFIYEFSCFFTPSRLDTKINISLIDACKPKVCPFLFLFITKNWLPLFEQYSDAFRLKMVMLFGYIELLAYKGPEAQILSLELSFTLFDSRKIDNKPSNEQVIKCISQVLTSIPFKYCSKS